MTLSVAPLPSGQFQVAPAQDIFKKSGKPSLSQRICRVTSLIFWILLCIATLGVAYLIGRSLKRLVDHYLLPAGRMFNLAEKKGNELSSILNLHKKRDGFEPLGVSQKTVQTADGVNLDTLKIEAKGQEGLPPVAQKWVIVFNANARCYEQNLDELRNLSNELDVSVYTGNYRGVMRSEGRATSSQDLLLDGEAMVQYLLSLGVKTENILVQGLSLGGAVAPAICALHQEPGHEMHLFTDRSLADISKVILALTPKGLGAIGWLVCKIVSVSRWQFNSVENFLKIKGHKAICFSREDDYIRYSASIYKWVKEAQMTPEDRKAKKQRQKDKLAGKSIAQYSKAYKPENSIKLSFKEVFKNRKPEDIRALSHSNSIKDNEEAYSLYEDFVRRALKLNS